MLKKSLYLSLLFALAFSPAASAHSRLIGSTPVANTTVKVLPTQVSVEFSEKILVINKKSASTLVVTDSTGKQVDGKDSVIDGRTISVSLKPTAKVGRIRLRYHVISEDGHAIDGTFIFTYKK